MRSVSRACAVVVDNGSVAKPVDDRGQHCSGAVDDGVPLVACGQAGPLLEQVERSGGTLSAPIEMIPVAHVVGGRAEPTDDYWGGTRAIIRIDADRYTPYAVAAWTSSPTWRSCSTFT
jgi:hypothetical protein